MSSYHGQTIYPLSFSSQVIEQSSVLSLCCIPGTIMWNEQRYSFVRSVRSSSGGHRDSTAVDSSVLLTPRNDYAHYDLKWEIYPADIEIEAGISLPNFPTVPTLEPRLLIIPSLYSRYVHCSHEKTAGFQPNGQGVVECPLHHQREIPDKVRIIQADNNERIRHATLASDYEFVIRMQACLECCIKCSVLNAISDGMIRVIC